MKGAKAYAGSGKTMFKKQAGPGNSWVKLRDGAVRSGAFRLPKDEHKRTKANVNANTNATHREHDEHGITE